MILQSLLPWCGSERRAATFRNPAQWLIEAFAGGEASSGMTVNDTTAMTFAAVYNAITLISDGMKISPLVLYRRFRDGARAPARDHPLYALLHTRPNIFMSAARFWKYMQAQVLLWGNAYALIGRNDLGQPVVLLPLHPSQVTMAAILPTGVVYRVRHADGHTQDVPALDMLHGIGYSRDGYQGESIVAMARNSLGVGLAAQDYGGQFFRNSARSSVALSHPSHLDPEAAKRLRESWKATYGGKNTQGVAILEEGLKLENLTMPNEDAQFLQTRQFQVTEVARWFNLPPHKIKDLSHATFSNIEHQAIEYVGDTIVPWAKEWEQECTYKLLTPAEREQYFCEFNVEGLLRGDIKARYDAYVLGLNNGILNPDEVRKKENLNPLPDRQGEVYLRPLQLAPAATFVGAGATEDIASPEQSRRMLAVVQEVCGRLLRKECSAARRAECHEDYEVRMRSFMDRHLADVRTALSPSLDYWAHSWGMVDQAAAGFVRNAVDQYICESLDLIISKRAATANAEIIQEYAAERARQLCEVREHANFT